MTGRSASTGADNGKKTALSRLTSLAREDFARRYPDLRPGQYPQFKYSDRTANGLTNAIIKFLQFSGWQAERISCTGRPVDHRQTYTDVLGHVRQIGSIRWITPTMQVGTADISATVKGKSVKIEVKICLDRQSEAQRRYQREVETAGGLYVIATSFEQFFQWFQKTF